MTPWATEVLDGFTEAVAEFGASITVGEDSFGVVELDAASLLLAQNAGSEDESTWGCSLTRADFTAAALECESRFTVSGVAGIADGSTFRVTRIVGMAGSPLVQIMAAIVG